MSKAVTMKDARKHLEKQKVIRAEEASTGKAAAKKAAAKKAAHVKDPDDEARKTLNQMTIEQLVTGAEEHGFDLGEATKKADIIEAIIAAEKASTEGAE